MFVSVLYDYVHVHNSMQCVLDMWDNSSSGAQLSLVPRPSPAPVFDCLQYAKTGAGEGLGMRLAQLGLYQVSCSTVYRCMGLHH